MRLTPSITLLPVAFFLALAACVAIYSVGFEGPFLFDDFPNLQRLGEYGGVRDLSSALIYIFGYEYSLGRPVSFASFLLDDFSWPSDPYLFKYHNALFHILAGVALFSFLYQLARLHDDKWKEAALIALLGTVLWLFHPLFVSTVLYIIQRMAILSTLFIFAGLAFFLAGRRDLVAGNGSGGLAKLIAAFVVCFPLAVLSKENGVLFILFVLILEYTVLQGHPVAPSYQRWYRWWLLFFAILPLAVLVLYFAVKWDSMIMAGYAGRDFTLEQRLLTEPRIILQYLALLIIPRIQTAGLYNDNFLASEGLLDPLTTLPALMVVVLMVVVAVYFRRRYPLISFSVLFFFAGHALESTFLPLELYFEHRNYLPAASLAFLLALGVMTLMRRKRRLAMAIATLLILTYSVTLYARVDLWSNFDDLTLLWAERNPTSKRVHQQAAILWTKYGRRDMALDSLRRALRYHPEDPVIKVQYLGTACAVGQLKKQDVEQTAATLETSHYSAYVYMILKLLVAEVKAGSCQDISYAEVRDLLDATLRNRATAQHGPWRQDLLYIKGYTFIIEDNIDKALQWMEKALLANPNPEVGMQITAVFAENSHFRAALRFLQWSQDIYFSEKQGAPTEWLGNITIDYPSEFRRIRNQLEAEIAADFPNSG